MQSTIDQIVVFDFDGTLFRSPRPPKRWRGRWWSHPVSLEPPCVPEQADDSWWVDQVVSQMEQWLDDPSSYVVVLTARTPIFKPRIAELLQQRDIEPDELLTVGYPGRRNKLAALRRLLDQFPESRYVEVWEDREKQGQDLAYLAYAEGRESNFYIVPDAAQDAPCTAQEIIKQGQLLRGGLADKRSISEFDSKALREGIKVEMEHTSDPKIAREIAMDHLAEDPRYYEKLRAIEGKPGSFILVEVDGTD